ncbi:hypothetical protein C8Q79DRAFT_1008895 [Trametes meyenii]|nr:hypothetical protein C8Q79DRAFT_1008895 [Trametes meyenii]
MSTSTIFSTDIFGIPHPVSTVVVSPTSTTDPATSTDTSTTTQPTDTSTTATTTTTSPTSAPTDTSTTTGTTTSTSTNTSQTITTTSTDTSTSATTSNTTSTSSATSTSATSTSATSTSAPATSSSSSLSADSTVFATSTDAAGQVITHTSVVFATPTVSSTSAGDHKSDSKGFFQNTGAVAGVFTVVGLAVVVIAVAIVTNAIRKRRAKKLDREIAEAAAEAAHAAPFTDDDFYPDDRLGKGGSSSGGGGDLRSTNTGYSDTTHGTFAQPPMSTGESYNMAELAPYDYGGVAAGGAAGIGAMGGLNRARSMGQSQNTTPYNAFAGPPANMASPYESGAYGQQSMAYAQRGGAGPQMDLLDAAGMGGAAVAAYGAYGVQQQQPNANLARNPSLGPSSATSPSEHSAYSSPYSNQGGYEYNPYNPAAYNSYQQPQAYPPQQTYPGAGVGAGAAPVPSPSPPRPTSEVDPYGGYVDEPLPQSHVQPPAGNAQSEPRASSPGPGRLLSGNFASPPASSEGHELHEDHRASIQDDDDYGYEPGRRVLKVANE